MKKLAQTKNNLLEIENLITVMDKEIYRLRNIVYRYNLLHGNSLQDGFVRTPDNIDFEQLNGKLSIIDLTESRSQSQYKYIQSKIK
jgi:hypothetical protein